jgi:hypothetical protein
VGWGGGLAGQPMGEGGARWGMIEAVDGPVHIRLCMRHVHITSISGCSKHTSKHLLLAASLPVVL